MKPTLIIPLIFGALLVAGCGNSASGTGNPKGHIECGTIQIHDLSTVWVEVPNKDGSFTITEFSANKIKTHHDLSPGSSQYLEYSTEKDGESTTDVLNVHLASPAAAQPSSSPSDTQRIIPIN